jgi:D-alanyl-D-alanine carboxypeptidase/D-alanyl-D-alanine-endopeptidase (penicillin-binding protein 4)
MTAGLIVGWGLAIGAGVLLWMNQQQRHVHQIEPLPGPPTADPRFAALVKSVEELENEEGFEAAAIALCVLDGAGSPVVRHQDTRSIIPASALKTVTTATALEKLGPDFRFKTLLQGTVAFEPAPETYKGDLVILGGGDPSFTKENLVDWAKWLASKGIKKLDGRVIGDGQVFPELIAAKAWDWGDVGNRYGAPVSGLNIDQNAFSALFRPGDTVGSPATLAQVFPDVPGVELINLMLTCGETRDSSDTPHVYGGPYSPTLTFRGAVRSGRDEEAVEGSVPDPAFAAAHRFKQAIEGMGITVTGKATTARQLSLKGKKRPEALQTAAVHQSEPLIELILPLHAESINLYAECLFRLLALESDERDGRKVIKEHWGSRGIDFVGLRMEDGSGLARADLIRAIDLARVNHAVRHGPHGDAFVGTLTELYDHKVRWKVGYMSRVRTHVGFVGDYTFVLAFNHHDASISKVSKARDRLMKLLIASVGL